MTQNADYVRDNLDEVRKAVADAGIRPADTEGSSYLKWDRTDGGYVIFRASCSFGFGSLDLRWRDLDGPLNGPFAPIRYEYLPWLTRDLEIALRDGPMSRDTLKGLGKVAQNDSSRAAR